MLASDHGMGDPNLAVCGLGMLLGDDGVAPGGHGCPGEDTRCVAGSQGFAGLPGGDSLHHREGCRQRREVFDRKRIAVHGRVVEAGDIDGRHHGTSEDEAACVHERQGLRLGWGACRFKQTGACLIEVEHGSWRVHGF